MPSTAMVPHSMSDTWNYALLGGLVSIPFTTVSYWQSGSELSLAPVLGGGLLAGYLVTRRGGTARGVGARAGLVGGLPVLWVLLDMVAVVSGLPNPRWFTAVSVGVAFGTAILGFGLAAFLGEIGGRIGGWLAPRGGQDHQTRPVN